MRLDTPRPPCRLLNSPPALAPIPEEDMEMSSDGETSSSDDGFEHIGAIEDVQDNTPALRTLARVAALVDGRADDAQEPAFVFVQDFDDEELQSTSSEEEGEIRESPPVSRAAALAIPALGSGRRGPLVTRDHYSSSPSMATETSTTECTEANEEGEGRTPLLHPVCWDRDCEGERESTLDAVRREVREIEEEVTLQFVAARMRALGERSQNSGDTGEENETTDGSMPSLTDVNSESDARSCVSDSLPIDPNADEIELSDVPKYPSRQLARSLGRHIEDIHQRLPTPVVDDNALAREYALVHLWSANYDREQEETRTQDDKHVAGPIWEILDILENGHLRHAVDRVLMETGGRIDEPTWNSLTRRPSSSDSQRLAHRVSPIRDETDMPADALQAQVNDEMLDIVSFRTQDGQRQLRASFKFPLKGSTRELRRFNARALSLGTIFRAALGTEAGKHTGEVVKLTTIREQFLTHLSRGTELLKRLGWSIDLGSLHDEDPDVFDLPFALPHENSQFRIMYHAFHTHGRSVIADASRELMKFRFKEPEFIVHLLCNGLLEPVPLATSEPDPPVVATSATTKPPNFRIGQASFDFRAEFPPTNSTPFQNDKPAGGSRFTQSWVDAAIHDQAVRISARAVEARNALEAKLDAVRNQSLHDCLQHGLTPCRPTYQLPAKALANADRKGKRKMSPRRSDLRQYTPSPLARAVYTPYASSSST
ncbi:hypothetical protein DFH06DRAFT_1130575 [Mycena polygramma]|nr:hypothetical protein DFH06DRAFT_1130575 [Mycena polygramma]